MSMPASPSHRPQPLPRSHFRQFVALQTRWADNDIYGHVNNVAYYAWFDTAVNQWLIAHGALDIHGGACIGLAVHTECDYFESLSFPQAIEIGLRVARRGSSSVHYELGVFAKGASNAAAVGRFVHVYVDRQTRKPIVLPDLLSTALDLLC
jgi:acyl-CoA thioester hydrolase